MLFILFCATVLKIWTVALEKYGPRSRLNLDYIETPAYVQKMPGRGNNYCAGILSAEQIEDILHTGLIRTVIHLGIDTSRIQKTREVCAAHDVDFFCIHPGALDAKKDIRWRLLNGQTLLLVPKSEGDYWR